MHPAAVRLGPALLLTFCLLAAPIAAGCGGSAPPALSYGESARRDYDNAMEAYADGDCLTAEPLFQHVVREYGYSRFAALAELRVADCELSQQHYTEAIRRFRSFVRARPTHVHVDYANFQIAVCYYRQIPTDIFLTPPREERDQNPTRSALRVVRRFLRDYPESLHAAEGRDIERECLRLLAHHELYVAGFYLQRDRPLATVGRLEYMLAEYAGSGLDADALLLLGRTYLHMREREHARRSFQDLLERFPDSVLVVQAQRYLNEMDADPGMGRAPGAPDAVDAPPSDEEAEAAEAAEEEARERERERVEAARDAAAEAAREEAERAAAAAAEEAEEEAESSTDETPPAGEPRGPIEPEPPHEPTELPGPAPR